jgi:hypothetical protein
MPGPPAVVRSWAPARGPENGAARTTVAAGGGLRLGATAAYRVVAAPSSSTRMM